MPDTTSSSGSQPPPEPTRARSKARPLVAGVLCVGLAAGGYVIGGRSSSTSSAVAAAPEAAPVHEPQIAEIVDLPSLNVNLAGGHYLRVAVSLGLAVAHATTASGGHDAGEDAESGFPTAPASDLVLSTFFGREMADLADGAGREAARADLLAGLQDYYGDDQVLSVFFTEFVMQ